MDYVTWAYQCLFVFVLASHVQSQNSYLIITPKIVRPGRVFSIEGNLLETPASPVTITAKLKDASTEITSTQVVVTGTESFTLDLSVPTALTKSSAYRVSIDGIGGLDFREEKAVTFEEKSSSVFIQTDKSVYKPGQTVHFRVFGITPDPQTVIDKLQVEMFDSKGNKIKVWHVSGAEMTTHGGVYVQQQQLSEFPVLGTWKLKAKFLSYGTTFEEQTFKVDEYVLPKFEVDLDLPSYGKTQDTQFAGKVIAKYTYGKPVKGEVNLRITLKGGRGGAAVEIQFPIEGTAKFDIPASQLSILASNLDQKTLGFEANVTETLTRSTQKDQQGITFYKVPHKVEFPKSLPNTFKPGLPYNAMVKISQRDDTPLDQIKGQLKVTVTEYARNTVSTLRPEKPRAMMSQRRIWRPRPRPPPNTESSKRLPPTYHTIPADGIVAIPIMTSRKPHKLVVEAEYDGSTTSLTLKKRHSPSNSFLQLSQISSNSKAGALTEFEIRRTSRTVDVNYQVFSRGKLTDSGKVQLTGPKTKWNLMMTSTMAPKSRIIIFHVRTDGEVVADALNTNVEGVFANKVTLAFNRTVARPGDNIQLDVKADAGSVVHILGVDKSVLLLGTGNDISTTEVVTELQTYDTKPTRSSSREHPVFCDWFCWHWPISVGGEDVKDVFEDAGVLVFTDANVYEHREIIEPPWEPPIFARRGGGWGGMSRSLNKRMRRPTMMSAIPMSPQVHFRAAAEVLPTPQKELAPVQRIRRLFPETWLWLNTSIPLSGKATVRETVPDTITSWIATAFAIHPTSGLGITENAVNLQVSLPFFVSVRLPYSVVRGEKVVVQVNIHNYSPGTLYTYVELEQSLEYDNILMTDSTQNPATPVVRTVTVASEDIASVYFPIIPKKLGQIDIKIKAQTSVMSDAIVKKLLVKPEGTEREYNLPVIIDLNDERSFTTSVNVEFPASTVPGSERVKATVIGDIMGPSIKGLDKLLKMPYGCGEQNMLKFAPNIFIVKYLNATRNLDENTLKQALNFMESGYQRELTYAHSDGSFSAFGERDISGSTWLTAFVLKSFVQAKPFIYIDNNVIMMAVYWLVEQQNTDGTFKEPGRVIHKAMQGGSIGGKVSLTAYVLIALLEAKSVEGVLPKIAGAQQKALTFLEGEVGGLTDVYDLAIVTYCLRLAQSPKAGIAWQKLNVTSINQDGMKHWEKVTKSASVVKPWAKKSGQAVDIELNAYALLALASGDNRHDGSKVLKWLTGQRNKDGGFSSTQDTVMALQGLAEMAALIYSHTYDLTIGMTGTGLNENFQITTLNALVLQSREVPSTVGTVTLNARGQGLAFAQLAVVYNINSDEQKESFNLTVVIQRETLNEFDLRACTRWLGKDSSSMALLEIGTPSGFYPDMNTVVSEPGHKRAEVELSQLVLYYDEIGRKDTCAHVTMRRVAMVAGAQPVAVRVMDYYDPDKSVTEFYIPKTLQDSQVCEICKDCDHCLKAV